MNKPDPMDASQNAPSLSQAIRIKKLAQQGEFDYDAVYNIMNEEKKNELDTVTIKNETLRKYFPRSYTPRQMESIIIKLLDQWQLKKQQAKQKKQGKQSVRTLLRQNRGVSSVEISKTGIKGFERYAKKYGIDYAIRKDSSEVPPKYLVFFKAPDAEAFQSAFKEYSASLLSKSKRKTL